MTLPAPRIARFTPLLGLLATGGALAATGFLACGGSTTTATIAPTTGIVVRAETLTSGKGCGRGATQVFKYVAVVLSRNSRQVVAGNVYDCFADGTFVDLDPVDGSVRYDLEIFAYNESAATAAGDLKRFALDPVSLRTTGPTWSTLCRAEQLDNVLSLAQCAPLAQGLGGLGGAASSAKVTLSTKSFPLPDGGAFACGDGVPPSTPPPVLVDGGADGGDGGAADGGPADAAAPTDAAAPRAATYRSIRYVASGRPEPVDLPCENGPVVIDPAAAPADLRFDVAMFDANGAALARTSCLAKTSPGLTSVAVCEAVRPAP